MENGGLTHEQRQALTTLAQASNEKLETAANAGATQAFNLGCSIGLLPVAALVVLVFFLSRANWVMATLTVFLGLMAVLGFANFAAFQAKTNTLRRTYQRDTLPEIERTLNTEGLSSTDFDRVADETLANNAALRSYLPTERKAKK